MDTDSVHKLKGKTVATIALMLVLMQSKLKNPLKKLQ
jgi:hypothetical protein